MIAHVHAEDRPRTNQVATRGKFYDTTTTKTYFKDWGAYQRIRHGDFHEAYKKLTFPEKVGQLGVEYNVEYFFYFWTYCMLFFVHFGFLLLISVFKVD